MKGIRHISFLVLLLSVISCSDNGGTEPLPSSESMKFNCFLSVAGETVDWQEGESVSLHNGLQKSGNKGTMMLRSTSFASGSASAWTAYRMKSNMYYAFYPMSRISEWASDGKPVATVDIPSVQVAQGPGLCKEASLFVARTTAMEKAFHFEPALSLLSFTIDDNSPLVRAIEVKSASGAALAGSCQLDLAATDLPSVVKVDNPSSSVTLTSFDGECPLETGVYYIGIAPGAYAPGDLSVIFHYNNGRDKEEPLTLPGKLFGGSSWQYGALVADEESGGEVIGGYIFPTIEDTYDIFLLIGQSNMAGRGYLTDADKKETVTGVYLLGPDDSKGQAAPVAATHPFNQYSTVRKDLSMQQMNPGYGFVTTIRGHTGGRPILIVCNARGGTALSEWAKGTNYYNEAVRRTLLAMQYGRLKGILWHQGCADSADSKVAVYMTNLSKMVSALREDLKSPNVPFIAGQLPYWRSNSPNFNNMIQTIKDNIPNSDWVSAEGCTPRGETSDPHFSRDGQILLGQRYGEKIKSMVYPGM